MDTDTGVALRRLHRLREGEECDSDPYAPTEPRISMAHGYKVGRCIDCNATYLGEDEPTLVSVRPTKWQLLIHRIRVALGV